MKKKGFTLIEVMLALAVIAIALTALLQATGENVRHTTQLKEKMLQQWVSSQAINMIQLGFLTPQPNQPLSEVTSLLGTRWFWRATFTSTPITGMQRIDILMSPHPSGPFKKTATAFTWA